MTRSAGRENQTVLVLGAYGLIGSEIFKALHARGYTVLSLGRSHLAARRVLGCSLTYCLDMSALTAPKDWHGVLAGVDVVVNCAGALQDGGRDQLEAVHHHSVSALARACQAQDIALIHISAVGAVPRADTLFMASKGRGEEAILAAQTRCLILRPGFVIARGTYGGSAMIKGLARLPVGFTVYPLARIQVAGIKEISDLVDNAIQDGISAARRLDVVSDERLTLSDLVATYRHWLGYPPVRVTVYVPGLILACAAGLFDRLAWLGWRPAMRSTALRVLSRGIEHDGDALHPSAPTRCILQRHRASPADRAQATLFWLWPLAVVCLALFWILSGIIGLVSLDQAAFVLVAQGWNVDLARASVVGFALMDIAIGILFGMRRYVRAAAWAAIGLAGFYIASASVFTPGLWLDPLGPLIKIFPALAVSVFVVSLWEPR